MSGSTEAAAPTAGSELVSQIRSDLSDRSLWDTRQSMFYEMRFNGLRRKVKPWPNASDVHFPLADSFIEKLKPYYFQQLFATDQLAAFVPNKIGVDGNLASEAAAWLDYRLKQCSNLESEILICIDKLLMSGRPAMKVIWDTKLKQIKFVTVPAHQLVVPPETRSIEEADRIVHVQTYSVGAYKRQPNFKQDAAFIKRITGSGSQTESENTLLDQAKYRREGLTHGARDQIVLWEIWDRDESGGWQYRTISPLAPDEPVRAVCKDPYDHGSHPFIDFPYEVTDAGYYSARGVVEIVAVFEAELCKLLNEKNDAMTLFNRPMFTSTNPTANTGNLRFVPGQILPDGIQAVQMPAPPISFDIQINQIREIAEGLVGTPDFGATERGSGKDPRTATEIQAIGQVTQQSSDLRMRIFRGSLGRLYRMAWSLHLQFAKAELATFSEGGVKETNLNALKDVYSITPSGSADGVNKSQSMQKAMARFNLFKGDPFIAQDELRKSLLESDDAGLVKRLFQDPGLTAATQAEQQAQEITVLRLGFPAVVSPADDDAVHLQTIMAYVKHQSDLGQPPKASEMQFLSQHAQAHLQQLHAKDPKAARQAADAWATVGQMLAAQAQQNSTNAQPTAQPVPPQAGAAPAATAPAAPIAAGPGMA